MQPKANPTAGCGNCGADEPRFLHHVRHRGIFRRLCTSCVLRLHPQSFCPTCFQVHLPPPTPQDDAVLTCTKCYSISHTRCVSSSSSSYACPLCTHPPGTPLFKLKSAREANLSGNFRVMDTDAARKLLAAAKISRNSINAATVCAWAEAERRAKEAGYARKRAKEALEYLAYVAGKVRRKEQKSVRPQVHVDSEREHSPIRGGDCLSREVLNVAADGDNYNNNIGIINYEETNGYGNGEVVDVDIGGEGVLVDDAAASKGNDSMNNEMVTTVDNSDGGEMKESVAVVEWGSKLRSLDA